MSVASLRLARDIFRASESGELTERQFVQQFGGIFTSNGEPYGVRELQHLFMKIDVDNSGSISWEEFTNYRFSLATVETESAADAEGNAR